MKDCPIPDVGYTSSNYDITGVAYTLVTPPVLGVEIGYENGELFVSSKESGAANVAYDIQWSYSDEPTDESGERSFSVEATVKVVDGEIVVSSVS